MSRENGTNGRRRQFTPEEKATILRRHLADKVPVSDLCDENHIQPTLFYLWQRQALEHLSAALQDGRTLRGQTQVASADRARVAALEAQIDALEKNRDDALVRSPVAGTVTATLVDAGEIVPPRAPLVVVTDLARPWANVYVDEPVVPRLRLGQSIVVVTDAGHRLQGTITFISPRAEFTPRNVQTADERSRLVYRVKVTVDNPDGILKSGMPVEAELPG